MNAVEPVLFGLPLHLLALYFVLYSFLGWVMETCYCSLVEKRFVIRGFLYGPLCPIYGVGVLMMICWFAPLIGNPLLFYVVATVCMSAWEYFVGWFLEVTTHMKYWDYSMHKFNLHGRICLWVCLTWGALAYLVIFWLHPLVSGLVLVAPLLVRQVAALVLMLLVVTDAAFTIRDLTLMSTAMGKLNRAREELRLQLALGRAELGDRISAARAAAPDTLDEAAQRVKARYDDLLIMAERRSRRFRGMYSHMSSRSWEDSFSAVKEKGKLLRERLLESRRKKGK